MRGKPLSPPTPTLRLSKNSMKGGVCFFTPSSLRGDGAHWSTTHTEARDDVWCIGVYVSLCLERQALSSCSTEFDVESDTPPTSERFLQTALSSLNLMCFLMKRVKNLSRRDSARIPCLARISHRRSSRSPLPRRHVKVPPPKICPSCCVCSLRRDWQFTGNLSKDNTGIGFTVVIMSTISMWMLW